jgi:hypothetical protein
MVLALVGACTDDGTKVDTGSPSDRSQVYEGDLTVLESPDHGPELCDAVADSLPPQCGGLPVSGWDWSAVDAESANGTTWGSYHVVGTFDGETFTLTEPPREPQPGGYEEPDFSPGCDEPTVIDPGHGQAEWDEMSSLSADGIPGTVGAWISRPEAGGDGTFSASVVVEPGRAEDATTFIRQAYGGPLCVIERDLHRADIERIQQELHDDEAVAAIHSTGSSYDLIRGVFEVYVWVDDDAARDYARDRWGDVVRLEGILQPVS